MSEIKTVNSNDIMLTLCQSVAAVMSTASGRNIKYTPLVQKITKTMLTPDIGTFVMFTGSFSGMVVINFPRETAMEIYTSYMNSMGIDKKDIAQNYTQEEVSNTLGELYQGKFRLAFLLTWIILLSAKLPSTLKVAMYSM